MNSAEDAARLAVEAVLRPGIADVADDAACDAFVINDRLSRNFAGNDDQASGQKRLASDA